MPRQSCIWILGRKSVSEGERMHGMLTARPVEAAATHGEKWASNVGIQGKVIGAGAHRGLCWYQERCSPMAFALWLMLSLWSALSMSVKSLDLSVLHAWSKGTSALLGAVEYLPGVPQRGLGWGLFPVCPEINALTFSSPYLDFISAFYLIKNKKRQKKTYIYVLKKKKMHTMLVTDSLIIASHHLLNNLYFPFPVQAPARRLPAELRGLHLLPSSPFSFPNSAWLQSENKPSHPLAYWGNKYKKKLD